MSGEEEAEFNSLSKLADSLPDIGSEEEDLTMEADPRYLRSQSLMRALLDPSSVDDTSEEEDSEGDERAKMEEEQVELDETVQQMMDMEISQRKDEGDMKGFEEGSKYRLEFNIWKTEREWELMKRHEAKSTPAAAEEENNTQAEEEHRGQENEANKEIDQSSDKESHGNIETPSRATYDKDLEGVKFKTMMPQQ